MTVSKRHVVDDDGALHHVLEYDDEDTEYDTIEIRHDPDDDSRMQVVGYNGDEEVYQQSFEMRDLSFEPISAIGRGESERLTGTSPASEDGEIPEELRIAFNAIGMAVVPNGEEWLDE